MAGISSTAAKELSKAGYNSIAPAYLDFVTKLPSPNIAWVNKLLTNISSPPNARVLELGCGNGVPCTQHLASKVGHITANDISSAQLDLATEKLASNANVSFIAGDMTELSFSEASFDAVMVLYSLQHLPRDEQPAMIHSVHDWLKPGGLLLCCFGDEDDPGTLMENWLGATMFHSGWGVEKSKELVVDVGFELVEAEVIANVDGKRTVPFLWVLARKNS